MEPMLTDLIRSVNTMDESLVIRNSFNLKGKRPEERQKIKDCSIHEEVHVYLLDKINYLHDIIEALKKGANN